MVPLVRQLQLPPLVLLVLKFPYLLLPQSSLLVLGLQRLLRLLWFLLVPLLLLDRLLPSLLLVLVLRRDQLNLVLLLLPSPPSIQSSPADRLDPIVLLDPASHLNSLLHLY